MEPVRFGMIGLGRIAARFATVLQGMAEARLTAVASRDRFRSEDFARTHHATEVCRDYLAVVQNPDVDIVYIGLTHNDHYEMVKLCLENHKAVLCEKPLVIFQHQAAELVDLARRNQTLLMEALWTRCLPAFQQARAWVAAGKIGAVRLMTAEFHHAVAYDPESRLFNPRLAGGSLFDLGVYPISFATGILGAVPVDVTGAALLAPSGVDEAAVIALRFDPGALASLSCGFNTTATGPASIHGSAGHIEVENCFGPQRCSLYDGQGELVDQFAEPVPDGFVYQIRHCADLYRQGQIESPLIPWRDTLSSAAIFDTLSTRCGIQRLEA
ncbi:MAG TPA: Gfo/Idh/MocA family oxidoreductase [Anaerolineaceae bacterium]|nr:Gfo/Idh/MocA family oxidoreductase [Anaerolineaceae bacterium]